MLLQKKTTIIANNNILAQAVSNKYRSSFFIEKTIIRKGITMQPQEVKDIIEAIPNGTEINITIGNKNHTNNHSHQVREKEKEYQSRRYRFGWRKGDKITPEWIANQTDPGASIRELIRQEVEKNGFVDLVNATDNNKTSNDNELLCIIASLQKTNETLVSVLQAQSK